MSTEELMAAAQNALEALEALQGGCTDHDDGTVEAITVWCPEVIDALRAALAQRADEPVAWAEESAAPTTPGWYAVRRADGSLCLRAFGKDEQWWIPLKDGWLSGLPAGFSWFGPLEPIEWDTPAAPAAPTYAPLSESDIRKVHNTASDLPDFIGPADMRPAIDAFARAIEALVVARMRGEGK